MDKCTAALMLLGCSTSRATARFRGETTHGAINYGPKQFLGRVRHQLRAAGLSKRAPRIGHGRYGGHLGSDPLLSYG
eukprot:440132-Pyramimonas_sp.AAC.1